MPVAQHDQIFIVLAGHNPGQAHRTDTNKFGHLVYQVMADYQDRWQTAERSEAKSSPHEQPKMTDAESNRAPPRPRHFR